MYIASALYVVSQIPVRFVSVPVFLSSSVTVIRSCVLCYVKKINKKSQKIQEKIQKDGPHIRLAFLLVWILWQFVLGKSFPSLCSR